jgi:sterol desaturase/sphingolipid hydroxylase (fatty acid hydroxylase superfamily)
VSAAADLFGLFRYWPGVDALTLGAVVAMVAVTAAGEAIVRGRAGRYFSRNAGTDVLYTLFYLGGFYGIFVSGPLSAALNRVVDGYLPFLRLGLARELPAVAQAAVVVVLGDLVRFLVHRLSHVSPVLWEFHKVHHSQDELTPWTNYRAHFADFAVHSFALYGLGLLLGPSPGVWAPLSILMMWHSLLVHTGFDWSLGPLDRVIVSPRYHAVHHSAESRHFGRNFGMVFSFWDDLGGSADRVSHRPAALGLPGPRLPESFFRQLVWPFLALWRGARERAEAPGRT